MGDEIRESSSDQQTVERVLITIELAPQVVHLLQQACAPDTNAGVYLEHLIVHRERIWRRSVNVLENAGWDGDNIGSVCAALRDEVSLDAFTPKEIVSALRWSGLRKLSRRAGRRASVAEALLCVVVELCANNAVCARAVRRMRPRVASWWQRI